MISYMAWTWHGRGPRVSTNSSCYDLLLAIDCCFIMSVTTIYLLSATWSHGLCQRERRLGPLSVPIRCHSQQPNPLSRLFVFSVTILVVLFFHLTFLEFSTRRFSHALNGPVGYTAFKRSFYMCLRTRDTKKWAAFWNSALNNDQHVLNSIYAKCKKHRRHGRIRNSSAMRLGAVASAVIVHNLGWRWSKALAKTTQAWGRVGSPALREWRRWTCWKHMPEALRKIGRWTGSVERGLAQTVPWERTAGLGGLRKGYGAWVVLPWTVLCHWCRPAPVGCEVDLQWIRALANADGADGRLGNGTGRGSELSGVIQGHCRSLSAQSHSVVSSRMHNARSRHALTSTCTFAHFYSASRLPGRTRRMHVLPSQPTGLQSESKMQRRRSGAYAPAAVTRATSVTLSSGTSHCCPSPITQISIITKRPCFLPVFVAPTATIATSRKWTLPSPDVFNQKRWFFPGP